MGSCPVEKLTSPGITSTRTSAFNITDHFLIMADLEIKPFVRPPPPTHSFRLTGSIDLQPSSKIFSTPNSFSPLPLPLKPSYPATTRHYLISSTFMPHSSPNSLLMPTTPGSPHTSKHLNP